MRILISSCSLNHQTDEMRLVEISTDTDEKRLLLAIDDESVDLDRAQVSELMDALKFLSVHKGI